jgi:hypothetical protein
MNFCHNKKRAALFISVLSILSINSVANAETTKKAVEQHGAHEHGVARLTIATSESGVEIALESPSANIFGFEHKPTDDADKATVLKAVNTLKDGGSLFRISEAAGCVLKDVDLESALIEDDHDDHKDDDHKDEHDDHKDDDHKDEHDDHKETHNDVDATWHFNCSDMAELKRVEVKLFSAFPGGFEEVDVDWITAKQAGHVELEADAAVSLTK